mgnify:CR=1 FL=1
MPPRDLLSLRIAPAVIGYGDFIDAPLFVSADLGGDFRFDGEIVGFDPEGVEDLFPEHLVAGLHVGEGRIVEEIRQEGEKPVSELVPEEMDPLRFSPGEP